MAREMNPNLYPPNGYLFRERDGSVHRGLSWKDVKKKVKEYRERNNIPVGDVWEEIMTQQCASSPGLCRDSDPGPVRVVNDGLTFNKKVIGWLAWALGQKRLNDWALVDEDEVDRRAAICASCPMQKSLNESCGACLETIRTSRKVLLDGKKPKYQNLQPCAPLEEDCASSVHAILEPKVSHALPGNCWRRG